MKKITLFLFVLFSVLTANAQYVFSPVAGPTNVAAGSPSTINLNDAANSTGVPASPSGSYDSFSVSADWVAGGGNPWSSEAEITLTTAAGSVNIDPPTAGGLNSNANTTLIFEGDLAGPYDPTTDGLLDLALEQSFGGSDADWSNITVTLFESPTCIEPSGMSASAVSATEATLDWTAGDNETLWNVEYNGGTDFVPGNGEEEGAVSVSGSPNTTLTGLAPATEYFVYYQADCGTTDGTSVWVGPFSFSTECVTFTAPYTEGFENGGTIPLCWTMDGGEDWFFDNDPGFNHIGDDGTITGSTATNGYFAWCDSSGDEGPRTLTSPMVDVSGLSAPALSFYEISDNEGNANSTLDVEVWDGAAWNNLGTYNTNTNGWELKIIGLGGLTITGDVQARFIFSETVTGDFYDDIAIDDVTFDEAPTCFDPTFLNATAVTATGAQLEWTQSGSALQWNVEIVTAGTAPTQTPTDAGVTNPFNASGLTPATDYEYYVQADCGGELSGWAGPFAFSTECVTFTAPYTEGFENGGTIPLCWTMDGGEDWFFDNDPGFNHIGDDGTITGSTATNGYFAWCDSSGDEGPRTLTSPMVDVSGLSAPALSFYEISDNEGNANSTLDVEVWDGAAWNNLGTYNTNTNGWELKIIGLGGLTITGDVQARFIFSETVTGDFYDDIAIDDVTFDEAPDCIPPSSITISNITGNSADINWIGTNGETSWEYVVSIAGTGEPTGPGTTVASPSVNETGLSFTSSYEVWVRADCGANGFSDWAGPITFDTPIQTDFALDCTNDGPLTIDYCYENGGANDPVVFTFTSNDGTPLNLNFNSGFVENNWDELVVIDSDGNPFPGYDPADQNYGNGGNIGGLSFQSTGDNISFYINSDGSVSCQSSTSGNLPQGINYTVSCATCINPQATYTVIDDCDNGDQFLIDVDISSLGDASSLTVSNNINGDTVPVTATGTYQTGPFPFLQDVIITVSNDQDVNCVINSQPIQLIACPPVNDNCEGAIAAVVNDGPACDNTTPGTILAATPSGVPAGSCTGNTGDDVWFEFTALNEVQIISLLNITGGTTNIDHAVYEGTCGSLSELYCSNDDASVTPQLTIGGTYYIRVFSGGSDNDETSTFDLCIREAPSNIICQNAENFCSLGGVLSTPNIVGIPDPNDLACLGTAPNPVWNIIQIGEAGPIEIEINQFDDNGNGLDVDFAIWGPFTSVEQACTDIEFIDCPSCPFSNNPDTGFYPFGNIVDCSYSAAPVENLSIDNAQSGEIYMLLVTNFNGNPGTITIEQTNVPDTGSGTIEAEISAEIVSNEVVIDSDNDPTETDEVSVCGFDSVTIEAESPFADTFTWYRNGFVIAGETSSSLTVTESDSYQVVAFDNQCGDEAISQIVVVNLYNDPGAIDAQTLTECDGPEADGEVEFDLEAFTSSLGLDPGFTVSYYTSNADANQAINAVSSPYISSGETLVMRIEDIEASNDNFLGCRQLAEVSLVVNPVPSVNQPMPFEVCDDSDGNVDGETQFDLESINPEVSTNPNVTITYHETQVDADNGTADIASPYTSGNATIYIRVEDNTTGCYNTTSFNLIVNSVPLAQFDPQFDYEVCPNSAVSIIIGLVPENFNASDVSITWSYNGAVIPGETDLVLDSGVIEQGDYTAEIVFNSSGCTNIVTTFIEELPFCEFPQGISPNNDMSNDTFDLRVFDVTKLEIFNRNGTLVYSKTNYTNEWQGQTNDGEELPVGTYFYTVEYEGGTKRRSAWVYINR